MTSKDCKRVEIMALRSSKRGRSLEEKEEQPQEPSKAVCNPHLNEHLNQIEDHK